MTSLGGKRGADRARIGDFCLVELVAESVEGGVLDKAGLTVDLDEEFVAGGVCSQVDAGGKKRTHEIAGVGPGCRGLASRG